MEALVGRSEADALMAALQSFPPKSIRFNRLQTEPGLLAGEPVPWCCPYGRYWYLDQPPSLTIDYAAGRFYIQEASAMLAIAAASRVMNFNKKVVLDLTAAPGGKATQTAELIENGYLVANEVVRKRVDALCWNINRHRLNNVIVTSFSTAALAAALPEFFDIVVVDAPCSGEGLFQKRKHSPANWSAKNVRFCAARQQSILGDAIRLLKPDGYLVYSTCTFAPEENENQVEFLLGRGFDPVPLPLDIPVSAAISGNPKVSACSRRIFPHREGGAGAFVGILKKDNRTTRFTSPETTEPHSPFINSSPVRADGLPGHFYQHGGIVSYFSHNRIPTILVKKNIQLGAPVLDRRRSGQLMFGSIQLARPEDLVELSTPDAQAYIQGKDLNINRENGDYFTASGGAVLGPVSVRDGIGFNRFPRPLMARQRV